MTPDETKAGMNRETVIRILLVVLSSFCVIIFSEMILHIFAKPKKETVIRNTVANEKFPYRFIPHTKYTEKTSEFSITVKINNVGLRDYDYLENYPRDNLIILGIGDSFTWGAGVNMEEGYLAVAENILRKNSLSAEIIKAGMPGYEPISELSFVEHYIEGKLNLKFNMLTIGFLPNDIDELVLKSEIRYGQHGPYKLNNVLSSLRNIIRESYIYQRIKHLKLVRTIKGKKSGHYCREMNAEEKDVIAQIIKKAKGYSTSIPVLFVLIPQADNIIYKCYPDMFNIIKELAAENDIFFVDTFFELVKYEPDRLYYKQDQHLTKLGYEIVGRVLANKIMDLKSHIVMRDERKSS
jgi:hypothetical protein